MKPKTQNSGNDPALEAIQDLGDSVATSFEVLETENKQVGDGLRKLGTEMRAGFKQDAARMTKIEGGGRIITPSNSRWTNPGRIDSERAMIAEWWRGRLLTGAGSESVREQGRRIMENALPGELARVQEFFGRETAAAFGSADDYVPVTIENLIDGVRAEPSWIADLGQMIEMGSDTHKVPKETTAPVGANVPENGVIAEDAHAVGSTTLDAIKGASLRHFAIEAVMDASPDLIEHWIRRLVESLDELETQQALEGDGVGDNFLGVKTAVGVNEVDLVNGGVALADLDLLAQMVTSIPASERDPVRCAWFVSSDGLRLLLQIQNATEKSPMLGQTPRSLFGFPVIVTDQIATTAGVPDTSTVYFGNWRGVLVGRRGPLMLDTVAEGAGAAFAAGQISVRVIRRYAVITHLPALIVRGINLWVAT